LLPIYKGGTYGYWASSIGLYIYDWLAGVARKERRIMLNRKQTLEYEPMLKSEGLKGAGFYYEYRTDDARLTLDIMKTASAKGAKIVNYSEVKEIVYSAGKAVGVRVKDRFSGNTVEIAAKCIVNATGPWVDGIRKMDGSFSGKRLFLTKGVHLVVRREKLPVKQSAYFDTPDGRMVFVIPRGKITYIGTTDTAYHASPDRPRTTEEDRDYLLRAVNSMFPEVSLRLEDVDSHWAGLRPLIYEEGKGPSELSRKDEIFLSHSGLITIAGGKLTGFRKMAEKVVNLVGERLGTRLPACSTDQIKISGGDSLQYTTYAECRQSLVERGLALGLSPGDVEDCLDIYGTNAVHIMEKVEQGASLAEAQVQYSVDKEMAVTVKDIVVRRTGWTYFERKKAEKLWEEVLDTMAAQLGWDDQRRQREKEAMLEELRQLTELPTKDEPANGEEASRDSGQKVI
jgi:glycerol-3-phosphate dehydrogenase